MSVIAFKTYEDKFQVGADGIELSDNKIVNADSQKIHKMSDGLIIGSIGLANTNGIYKKFVEGYMEDFENTDNLTNFLMLFKEYRDYLIDEFGYSLESMKELGGHIVVNKHFHGVFYFEDNYYYPYCTYNTEDRFAYGATGIYTSALLDVGIEPEEAIKISAKKYNNINDHVTVLEISR